MNLPFEVNWTYKRDIVRLTESQAQDILRIFDKHLEELKVDIRSLENNKIVFKNSFFNGQGRNHLMSSVDKGSITIDLLKSQLIYKISVTRMFLILSGICLIFIILSWKAPLFIPITLVSWLLGMNMLIARIRHSRFTNKLKKLMKKA